MPLPIHIQKIWPQTALSAVLLMLLGAAGAAGAAGTWEKVKVTDDGIAVYSRTTSGTTVREVRARMTIDAPAKMVFEAVCDPATFGDTTKKYVEKNLFYHIGDPNVWYNYQLLNIPVIAKRDYCLRYEKIVTPQKGFFVITWHASNQFGPPPQEGIVRLSNIKGRIEVAADRYGNRTTVRYTLLADPGGNIPTWLINFANRRSLPDILRQIQDASLARVKQRAGK